MQDVPTSYYGQEKYIRIVKRLEFELNFFNIQENPVDFRQDYLSDEEIEQGIGYCKNDVEATYEFLLVVLGETDHPLYKENNQIEMRQSIKEEFGIPVDNYSDSKIGDEVIKKFYCEETGLDYKELPKKGTFRSQIKLKHCVPSYIEFKTPQLQKFLTGIKKRVLLKDESIDEEIDFKGVKYTFKKGGIHTVNRNQKFVATNDILVLDYDVSSFYPRLAIINNYYPYHLGKSFMKGYEKLYNKRIELKPLSKKDKKIKGVVNAIKLSLNSVYGKSGDIQSWLYDRQMTTAICIAGELTLMMLNEAYELEGIRVISSNTDGTTVLCPKNKYEKLLEINKWFEQRTSLLLEETKYKWIYFSTVNDYIAEKIDPDTPADRIKQKGDMVTDFFLHMNKSKRVVNLAIYEYFVNGVRPEDFIPRHQNVFDFCARQKASRNFYYTLVRDDERIDLQQLVRYVISKDGYQLLKIKSDECDTNAAKSLNCEAEDDWGYQPKVTECNRIEKGEEKELLKVIDHDWYIDAAYRLIDAMEGRKFKTRRKSKIPQLTLFG